MEKFLSTCSYSSVLKPSSYIRRESLHIFAVHMERNSDYSLAVKGKNSLVFSGEIP